MLRVFSCFGLGILFLMISPELRQQATAAIGAVVTQMTIYAPWSYVAGGIFLILSTMMAFKRGAAPR